MRPSKVEIADDLEERKTVCFSKEANVESGTATSLAFTRQSNEIAIRRRWARKRAPRDLDRAIRDRRIPYLGGERIRLVLRRFLKFLVRRHLIRGSRAAYISQNQIASKVHSPDSPSASKEVGRDTSNMMQALVSCPFHIHITRESFHSRRFELVESKKSANMLYGRNYDKLLLITIY